MPTSDELRMLQALPLDLKIKRTQQRIREWVDYWGKDHVCVSFSGGKDSTVLLHIVRKLYGDEIPAVFVNTGLEHIEIQQFVKGFSNVVILRPEINFKEVITRYGYPVISKEVSKCIEVTRAYAKKFVEVDPGGTLPNVPVRTQQLFWMGGYSQSQDGLSKNSGWQLSGRVPDNVMQLLGIGPYCRSKPRERNRSGSEDVRSGTGGTETDKGEYP